MRVSVVGYRALISGLLLILGLAGGAGSAGAAKSGWSTPLPSGVVGDANSSRLGVLVDQGRVWWLVRRGRHAATGGPVRYELQSRALTGGRVLATRLDTSQGVTAEFPRMSVSSFSLRVGQLVLLASYTQFSEPGDGGGHTSAPYNTISRYDLHSGSFLGIQSYFYAADQRVLIGFPAVLQSSRPGERTSTLLDPTSGVPFAATPSPVASGIAGDTVLSFDSSGYESGTGWVRGRSTLRVQNLISGQERYRLSGQQVTRKAGTTGAAVTWAHVDALRDGSLRVELALKDSPRRGLRPTWVDASGRVRSLPWRIPNAISVSTTSMGGRVLVRFVRQVGRGMKIRSCVGWWLSDPAGKRGRSVALREASGRERRALVSWDRRYAVFVTEPPDNQPGIEGIRVDRGFHQLRLTSRARPTCKL